MKENLSFLVLSKIGNAGTMMLHLGNIHHHDYVYLHKLNKEREKVQWPLDERHLNVQSFNLQGADTSKHRCLQVHT